MTGLAPPNLASTAGEHIPTQRHTPRYADRTVEVDGQLVYLGMYGQRAYGRGTPAGTAPPTTSCDPSYTVSQVPIRDIPAQ